MHAPALLIPRVAGLFAKLDELKTLAESTAKIPAMGGLAYSPHSSVRMGSIGWGGSDNAAQLQTVRDWVALQRSHIVITLQGYPFEQQGYRPFACTVVDVPETYVQAKDESLDVTELLSVYRDVLIAEETIHVRVVTNPLSSGRPLTRMSTQTSAVTVCDAVKVRQQLQMAMSATVINRHNVDEFIRTHGIAECVWALPD